ncbi:EthD family reductase [Phenylobacterium sp. Root700]|uniref:EthD family reductase n=1 Tax=Phenylobacterium sp. Root700 TaxID=1736591 RepID=UPI0006F938A9|nr:EthD family reductase [Phenylobacterium sp. Root700]KRB52667.1 hypothetical protein ASE02_11835 [Phenylobacterium sp. Root700]
MIKVTILYPNTPGSKFDFDYYLSVHMPLSIARLGAAMTSITVERVVDPGAPWPSPQYTAICSFICESRAAYEAAFFPHMAELQADIPNYTDTEQVVLVSEIAIDHCTPATPADWTIAHA